MTVDEVKYAESKAIGALISLTTPLEIKRDVKNKNNEKEIKTGEARVGLVHQEFRLKIPGPTLYLKFRLCLQRAL